MSPQPARHLLAVLSLPPIDRQDLCETWPDHGAEEGLSEGRVTGNAGGGGEAALPAQFKTDFPTPGPCSESACTRMMKVIDRGKVLLLLPRICQQREVQTCQYSLEKGHNWLGKMDASRAHGS